MEEELEVVILGEDEVKGDLPCVWQPKGEGVHRPPEDGNIQ